jgi:hypothetical protein
LIGFYSRESKEDGKRTLNDSLAKMGGTEIPTRKLDSKILNIMSKNNLSDRGGSKDNLQDKTSPLIANRKFKITSKSPDASIMMSNISA